MDASDRFRRYEEEFVNASRNTTRLINQLNAINGNVDTIISISIDIEGEITEAEGFKKALEIELRSIIVGDKKGMQTKLIDYNKELKGIVEEYRKSKFDAEKKALTSENNNAQSRAKLMKNTTKLHNSTKTLENSRMLVAQTEGIGSTIMSDLEGQKELLESSHENVKSANQYAGDSKYVLRMIGNRAIIHMISMYLINIILFGLICIVIYYGFIKS